MSVPWLVMGLGILVGGVSSLWRFFAPRHGGPWVLAFFVSVFAVWGVSAYWIFVGDGASAIADHQLMRVQGIRGRVELTPMLVKLFCVLSLLGGVLAVTLMFSGAFDALPNVR
jgi:hypothetical protein